MLHIVVLDENHDTISVVFFLSLWSGGFVLVYSGTNSVGMFISPWSRK